VGAVLFASTLFLLGFGMMKVVVVAFLLKKEEKQNS